MKYFRFVVDKNIDEIDSYMLSRRLRGDRCFYRYISHANIILLPASQRSAAETYANAVEVCHGCTIEVNWPKIQSGTDDLTEEDILRLTKNLAIRSASLIVSGQIRAENWDAYQDMRRLNIYDSRGNILLKKLLD